MRANLWSLLLITLGLTSHHSNGQMALGGFSKQHEVFFQKNSEAVKMLIASLSQLLSVDDALG